MNISCVIDISRHLLHPDCSVSGDCVILSLSWTANHEFSYCSRSLRPSLLAFTEFFGVGLKGSIWNCPASDQTDWCANSPVMKKGSTELKLVLKNKANRWVHFTGVPSKKSKHAGTYWHVKRVVLWAQRCSSHQDSTRLLVYSSGRAERSQGGVCQKYWRFWKIAECPNRLSHSRINICFGSA